MTGPAMPLRRLYKWTVAAVIVGHLLLSAWYSAVNPLGEAPDEADHWAYIVYLAREHRLPEGPAITQSKHPPLYHATAALVASLAQPDFSFLRANPDVTVGPVTAATGPNFFIHTTLEDAPWREGALALHLVRLWSVLLSTLAVAATFGLLSVAFPGRIWVAIGGTGVLAFLPEFAFIGGSANNDSAAALFGTLALWGGLAIYRAGGRWRSGWWTPLALGLGLLTKVSTAALWPVVCIPVALGVMQNGRARPRYVLTTGLQVFLPAALIAAPWFLRNWVLYGDPTGMALARQTVDLRSTPWTLADFAWLLKGWFLSFWGKFGGAGQLPMAGWIYGLVVVLSLLALAGILAWSICRGPREESLPVGLLALAIAATAFGMWRYSLVALGTDQGRLLYPAAAALTGLFAYGLLAWLPPPRAGAASGLLVLGSLALGLYGLLGVIRPAFAPPESVPAAGAERPSGEHWRFDDLELAGWEIQREPVLYWRAASPPLTDWRVVLRVVAEDGTLVWERQRSPGSGRWSSDHWPAGYLMRDVYAVQWPTWAGPGRYRVEVGAYPFGGKAVTPARGGPPASSGDPYVFLGWLDRGAE